MSLWAPTCMVVARSTAGTVSENPALSRRRSEFVSSGNSTNPFCVGLVLGT